VQAGNIRCNGIWCAVIINNIIRNGKALLARGLSGKNMFSMFARDMVARMVRWICVSGATSITSTRSAFFCS
jgi:hypothetical protein